MQYLICYVWVLVNMLYKSNNLSFDPMLFGCAQALYD